MNRTVRAIIAVVLIGIITFCAVSICQNIGGTLRADLTEQRLYSLSDGTKEILGKLNQPLTLKLYYTKTAARKAPDQIRFYNNYYYLVESLLQEYARTAKGKLHLEIIDPRPFSDEEEEALRYGLRRFPIPKEENFFFGLVLTTGFGVVKTIPFFTWNRHNFVEYDISHLIDTAITREKKRIGILSSLPVMGEDVTPYMARMMMMQGQQPRPAWRIVRQLQQQYDVSKVDTDIEEIKDVDILLVVHPKKLSEKTLFAIDQFVLKGGRAIICVDPHCFVDSPSPLEGQAAMFTHSRASDLNSLLRNWAVEMPENMFAGDRSLAMPENRPPEERLIGYLNLTRECVNSDNVISANLNQVILVFPGVLRKTAQVEGEESAAQNQIIPLLQTTNRGNAWTVDGPYELIRPNPVQLMRRFRDGSEPVVMGYLITGRFKSSFPEGIEVPDESSDQEPGKDDESDGSDETTEKKKATKKLTGLKEASTDCAVVVFADVDFISDQVAYQTFVFGIQVPVGNNSDLLLNAVGRLTGSGELIAIRSRGNFQRPFVVVKEIRREAEMETAKEEARINAKIAGFRKQLEEMVSSAKEGEEKIVEASIVNKQRELELEIRRAERELRDVQRKRREKIEKLGNMVRNVNMLSAPAVILVIAIILSIRRRLLRRRYVSHASDA